MFLSPWNLVQAILFALGIWWCKEMLSRLRDDVAKIREPDDKADRVVIIILWTITGLVLLLCVRFAWNIGASIVRGIRHLR
ncbi:MAG TPA: hypothetical protein VMF08_07465 [Candidatus Sulfotelmatobacter sp.]|nr:hypothetical protein [Candidatus Sulfotelmatobacter sp.]